MFDPTAYTVTEEVNELTIVRSGKLSEVTTVTVTTLSGTALGMSSSACHLSGARISCSLRHAPLKWSE